MKFAAILAIAPLLAAVIAAPLTDEPVVDAIVAREPAPELTEPELDVRQLDDDEVIANIAARQEHCPVGAPQEWVVDAVYNTARRMGASDKVMLATFEACVIESNFNNLPCGDQSSVGVLQQKDTWGSFKQRTTPSWAAERFLELLIPIARQRPGLSPGQLAQAVQRSESNVPYDSVRGRAETLLRAARARNGGGSGGGAVNVGTKPTKAPSKPKPTSGGSSGGNGKYAKRPGNAASGATSKCYKYYTVKKGQSPATVAKQGGTPLSKFRSLNKGLNKNISNMLAGKAYCVKG